MPVTGAEITTVAKGAAWLRRTLRRPDPVAVLKRRAELRAEIKQKLYAEGANWGNPPEILVIQLGKQDTYPATDRRVYGRGASEWFKGEVKGVHDRGLEILSGIDHVTIRKGKARGVPSDTPGAVKVWIVGRIPYERIAWIDWEPDPGYGAPRFYVAYRQLRHEAYREVVLYEGSFDDHLFELHDVKYVGEGGGPIARLKRGWFRVRFNLDDRRQQKEQLDWYSSDESG